MNIDTTDTDVLTSRRALAEAGAALADGRVATARRRVLCAWHGPDGHDETGAVCLVADGSEHVDLVSKRVRISTGERSVVLLCAERASELDADLSLTRVAWLHLLPAAAAPAELAIEILS